MRYIHPVFYSLILFVVATCCTAKPKPKARKIRSIEYYLVSGELDAGQAEQIIQSKKGLYKAEYFDTSGNLVKENEFDSKMNPDNEKEYQYNSNHQLLQMMSYKNYDKAPHTPTYLIKNVYDQGLLTATLHYYGTFDSSGFWARNTISYDAEKQKSKDEYISYNDDAEHQTSLYYWKSKTSYVEDLVNKEGQLAERHFITLDKNGRVLLHRMNFDVKSKDDSTYESYFEKEYDQYGNETVVKTKFASKPVEVKKYQYVYDNENWIYRVQSTDGSDYWTEFRKIVYY